MAFDKNNRFFRELAARILADPAAVIPFVGAGLSHYGVGESKLPLWRDLLFRLRNYVADLGTMSSEALQRVDDLLHEGMLIAATDCLVDAIGPTLFRAFIRKELDVSERPLSPAALSLVLVAWSLIVTTNLDEMLERAIEQKHARRPPVVTNRHTPELIEAINSRSSADTVTLAKIHGTLDDFASWCLTEKHYQQLLQRPDYQEILRSLFLKRLFFIGFGLSDRDFELVQDYLERIFPDGDTDCYALVPDTMRGVPRLTKLVQTRGLKPIYYSVSATIDPADPFGGHVEMYECLAALADSWTKARAEIRISLKSLPELEPAFVGRTLDLTWIDDVLLDRNRSVQIIGFGGEGKTSLVQEWLRTRRYDLQRKKFDLVFGFSFYSGSVDRFINDCFLDISAQAPAWDMARRLRFICDEAGARRIVFFLDGLEALLDASGAVTNPYLAEFLEKIERTDSRIIITSRIEVPGPFVVRILEPLTPAEIDLLVRNARNLATHPAVLKGIAENSMGHALSVRLAVSMLETQPPPGTPPWERAESGDARTANKLERTLEFYKGIMSQGERAFLSCFCVFDRPVRYDFLENILLADIPGCDLNLPLKSSDLRTVTRALIAKRLVIPSTGTLLGCHPNVRDYYRKHAGDLSALHGFIARRMLASGIDRQFTTLTEAEPLLETCHHAAGAGLWSEFHHIFHQRLMRGELDYLCDSLGAWSETLATVTKVFPQGDPLRKPEIEPEYYAAQYARCLKHLGLAEEATNAYLRTLGYCANSEHPSSALYANNFLTLQLYRGELHLAQRIAPWNSALLSWIDVEWKRCWQVEHGAYSIGWLALILGDLPTSRKLFELGESAWEGTSERRIEIFDHYPLYFTELFLNQDDPDVRRAEATVARMLDAATRNQWPETTIRAHIAQSQIERYKIGRCLTPESGFCLDRAIQACARAEDAAKTVFAPPLEVELLVEQLRLDIHHGHRHSDPAATNSRIARLGTLIDRLGWLLYQAEFIALQGLHAHQSGHLERARQSLAAAEAVAQSRGNVLAACGVSQSLPLLRARIGGTATASFAANSGRFAVLACMNLPRPAGRRLADAVSEDFIMHPDGA